MSADNPIAIPDDDDHQEYQADSESVANVCDITGATPAQARTYLMIADGNVEAAVGLYLESGGMDYAVAQTRHMEAQSASAATRTTGVEAADVSDVEDDFAMAQRQQAEWAANDDVRQPIAPQHDTLVGGGDDYTRFDFDPMGMHGVGHQDAMRRMAGRSDNPFENPEAFIHDPFQDADDPDRRLAQLFAPPKDLMFDGSFTQMREAAKRTEKWIMITLHDHTVFPCQTMNRDLWKDPGVKDIVRESFIFNQFRFESPLGQTYRNYYPVDSVPHTAIVDPRTGERVKIWSKNPSVAEFMLDVMDFLDANHLTARSTPSGTKKQKVLTESEQLAQALAESAKDAPAPQPTPVDENSAFFHSIKAAEREEPTAGETTTIQYRLADGKRIVRKFLKSDLVRVLFAHLKAVCPDMKAFELVCQRDALSKKLDETLQEANVVGSALIVDLL